MFDGTLKIDKKEAEIFNLKDQVDMVQIENDVKQSATLPLEEAQQPPTLPTNLHENSVECVENVLLAQSSLVTLGAKSNEK